MLSFSLFPSSSFVGGGTQSLWSSFLWAKVLGRWEAAKQLSGPFAGKKKSPGRQLGPSGRRLQGQALRDHHPGASLPEREILTLYT